MQTRLDFHPQRLRDPEGRQKEQKGLLEENFPARRGFDDAILQAEGPSIVPHSHLW